MIAICIISLFALHHHVEAHVKADQPIAGSSIYYLDSSETNNWRASAEIQTKGSSKTNDLTIPATVPGDLLSDLKAAGIIGEPYYEVNFRNSSLWDDNVWTYTIQFTTMSVLTIDSTSNNSGVVKALLVFDGIKMGAEIKLNGIKLGMALDQFSRWEYDVTETLLSPFEDVLNTLEVSFDSATCVNGRFMACTGGWDWAPYTTTRSAGTHANTFTKGLWKSVYVVGMSEGVAISHVVPQIKYRGAYPTQRLVDGAHSGFDVTVRVFFAQLSSSSQSSSQSSIVVSGELTVDTEWGSTKKVAVNVPADRSNYVTINVSAEAKDILLWWPNGLGDTHLYQINVTFTPSSSLPSTSTSTSIATSATPTLPIPLLVSRTVGFRHFALVTGNDTDPSYVKDSVGKDGTSTLGMFWRVNGAPLWSRGANMIPMDELEGRLDDAAHRRLVMSSAEANMNTLRVWGGGMFLPSSFYDECDKQGILVYHDMQYAQQGHAPLKTIIQEDELRHNVRRLASHASIVMWDGCNECHVVLNTTTGIYATFVMTVVAEEDGSRALWPSCPASGWTGGVDRLTSIPNGKVLTTPVGGPRFETHGPYQHGSGFPQVNGPSALSPFSPNVPISVQGNKGKETGIAQSNVFASEFGCVVMSSFESMSPTIDPIHWSLHGGAPPDNCTGGFNKVCIGNNVMAQRNYPCDSVIDAYFDTSGTYYSDVGELPFKRGLYHCMLGQAIEMKSNIETRKSLNEIGHILWQLNEIWPTGGWGSLEYGTPGFPGQVLGGRWKPLHYLLGREIFTDISATCGTVSCYVRNDQAGVAFAGTLQVMQVDIATGDMTLILNETVSIVDGPSQLTWFDLPKNVQDLSNDSVFQLVVKDDSGVIQATNTLLREIPKNIKGLPKDSGLTVVVVANGDTTDDTTTMIKVSSNVPVSLYVTLTTLAHGRFEDNAFALVCDRATLSQQQECSRTLKFYSFVDVDQTKLLQDSLRIEDLATYQ